MFVFLTFFWEIFQGVTIFYRVTGPRKYFTLGQWMEFPSDFGRTVGWANWHGVNQTGNPFFHRFDKK